MDITRDSRRLIESILDRLTPALNIGGIERFNLVDRNRLTVEMYASPIPREDGPDFIKLSRVSDWDKRKFVITLYLARMIQQVRKEMPQTLPAFQASRLCMLMYSELLKTVADMVIKSRQVTPGAPITGGKSPCEIAREIIGSETDPFHFTSMLNFTAFLPRLTRIINLSNGQAYDLMNISRITEN